MITKIRPHHLEKAVLLSIGYYKLTDFQGKLFEKSYECPALIYQLHKRGVFIFGDIEPF